LIWYFIYNNNLPRLPTQAPTSACCSSNEANLLKLIANWIHSWPTLSQNVHDFVSAMTSVDFAAAQERIEKHRQRRATVTRAHRESQRSTRASNVLSRLPLPLQDIGQHAIAVWDTIKGRDGTRPAFRVGQVDAELLDEELLELLRLQVGEGLKYFGVGSPFSSASSVCLISGSNTSGMTGLPRSCLGFELRYSNYPSGTKTHLTALCFKIFVTPMLESRGISLPVLPKGRRPSTV